MGLRKLFIFAVFSGISFAFSYRSSGDVSDVGYAFILLNHLPQSDDSQMQAIIMILSIIFTIFFIINLARFMYQVYEKRLVGILIALLGFLGSFLVLSSSQEQNFFLVIGLGLWIAGIALIIIGRKR